MPPFEASRPTEALVLSGGWPIRAINGEPSRARPTLSTPPSPLPQVNTLFPAPKVNGSIKGGVVLLRMKRPEKADTPLDLSVSYVDREGQKFRRGRIGGVARLCFSV